MYEKFYRLLGNPFALTPDPAYFFLGRQHQRALTLLEYALHQGSCFALISGRDRQRQDDGRQLSAAARAARACGSAS